MCGKKPAPPPPVVQRDPVAEQLKADNEAQRNANAETATRRRRRGIGGAMTSIMLRGAQQSASGTAGKTLLAQAKPEG